MSKPQSKLPPQFAILAGTDGVHGGHHLRFVLADRNPLRPQATAGLRSDLLWPMVTRCLLAGSGLGEGVHQPFTFNTSRASAMPGAALSVQVPAGKHESRMDRTSSSQAWRCAGVLVTTTPNMRRWVLRTPHRSMMQFLQSVSSGSPKTVRARAAGVLEVLNG